MTNGTRPTEMTASDAEPLLELRGVCSGYGSLQVLRDITIQLRRGEILTLIGANGAGKTTTLNTISNIVKLRAGEIRFAGERVDHLPPQKLVARGLIHVPEGRRLFSELTVLENLELGAYLRNDRPGIAADLERVYTLFPRLMERAKQRAGSLSGGEQQMCAIGRGLMGRPTLLLLDEPSLGLAPIIVQQIFSIIVEINKAGTSVLLVEQNAQMALKIANHAHVLSVGGLALSGTGAELLANDDVRKTYLGEA
ncbi:MAG: ABC transporter ATP-binding protein [Candidatus Sumerlaeia bacterium]|nr:ABC transporter ATP-binding protein [Candidatus Sumerlaeia bacterium]